MGIGSRAGGVLRQARPSSRQLIRFLPGEPEDHFSLASLLLLGPRSCLGKQTVTDHPAHHGFSLPSLHLSSDHLFPQDHPTQTTHGPLGGRDILSESLHHWKK